MLERRRFAAGETLVRENDLGETAFIIHSGRVEIRRRVGGDSVLLATVGAGDTVGEMSMIDDKPRSATAVAVEPTEVTEVHHDDFFEALQTDPQATLMILKSLFERLREANARVIQLEAGHAGAEVAGRALAGPVVVLEGASPEAEAALPRGPVRIDHFPFRIGRVSHNPLVHNDLELRDEMPWQISRHHVALVLEEGRVAVLDRGSTLGSALDGRAFGGSRGDPGPVPLPGAEARLRLGNDKSPYEFVLRVEPTG